MEVALIWIALIAPSFDNAKPRVEPPRGHSHNDYEQPNPLADALNCGFSSVEADIFLVDGKLLVAHARQQLRPEKTLQSLYLEPLRKRARANGGFIQAKGEVFWLFIDIKTEAGPTYNALAAVLEDHSDIVSSVDESGKRIDRAVAAIVSGNRDFKLIAARHPRYVGVDGRAEHLESRHECHFMPCISENWTKHFAWRGTGPMSSADREKLTSFLARAHARGRKVRFWNAPDNEASWKLQADAGVDLINTDKLSELSLWMRRPREAGK